MAEKQERITIRCDDDFKTRFRRFAAPYDNYQEALEDLLDEEDGEKKRPF